MKAELTGNNWSRPDWGGPYLHKGNENDKKPTGEVLHNHGKRFRKYESMAEKSQDHSYYLGRRKRK